MAEVTQGEGDRHKRFNKPTVKAGLAVLALLSGAVIYLTARSAVLIRNSQALLRISRRFPTDYFVGPAGGPPLTYVVTGDSTAVGTGASRVEETYAYAVATHLAGARKAARVHIINLARSGARIADVERDQMPALIRMKPDVITLSVGANDATHRTPQVEYESSLTSVMNAWQRFPKARILVTSTPDMALIPALQPLYAEWAAGIARKQNGILKRQAAIRSVQFVDLYGRGKLDAHEEPNLYASDRFHPSAKGYARWGRLFIEAL